MKRPSPAASEVLKHCATALVCIAIATVRLHLASAGRIAHHSVSVSIGEVLAESPKWFAHGRLAKICAVLSALQSIVDSWCLLHTRGSDFQSNSSAGRRQCYRWSQIRNQLAQAHSFRDDSAGLKSRQRRLSLFATSPLDWHIA